MLDGIQLWLALPEAHEEMEPAFEHHPADSLPQLEREGVTVRVLLGEGWGVRSPASSVSALLYAEAQMSPGSRLVLPTEYPQSAIYVASGSVVCGSEPVPERRMLIFGPDGGPPLSATDDARVMVLAGAPVGRRHMFWNFVSSSPERIEQAKRDWAEERFPIVPGDAQERIPLPD